MCARLSDDCLRLSRGSWGWRDLILRARRLGHSDFLGRRVAGRLNLLCTALREAVHDIVESQWRSPEPEAD